MYSATHFLIYAAYLLAPVVALGMAIRRQRRGSKVAAVNFVMNLLAGTVLGISAAIVVGTAAHARVGALQFALAIYLGMALLLLVRAVDAGLRWMLARTVRQPTMRWTIGMLIRTALLIGLALPYMAATALTFRLKVNRPIDAQLTSAMNARPVRFSASDGVAIAGWWIPAGPVRPNRSAGASDVSVQRRTTTILLCHGLVSDSLSEAHLAMQLSKAGFNVLMFDFRGHGASGGQMMTFGDLERRDVLGAIRWARGIHRRESNRIVGVGESMGAAALIAAAADPNDGAAIESIVVYDGYDSVLKLTQDLANDGLAAPMNWLAPRVGLPLASLQAGADLGAFAPAELVREFWPRPIMVIQATNDPVVSFREGERLFDAASFPKRAMWLQGEDAEHALHDDQAINAVIQFFDTARAMPLI